MPDYKETETTIELLDVLASIIKIEKEDKTLTLYIPPIRRISIVHKEIDTPNCYRYPLGIDFILHFDTGACKIPVTGFLMKDKRKSNKKRKRRSNG